jgi:hypothetical protein
VRGTEFSSNLLIKLARTFAMQLETLKRQRSTGEQIVKVQHAVVNDGGQAIVGTVRQGGGEAEEIVDQSHEPSVSTTECAAVPGQVEAVKAALQGTGGTRKKGMPLPRGEARST